MLNAFMNRLFPPPDGHERFLSEATAPSSKKETFLKDTDTLNDRQQLTIDGFDQDEAGRPLNLPRSKGLTQDELRQAYRHARSFADRLPYVEYLPESGCFLLEDAVSVGVAADVVPIATEGRMYESLVAIRDQIEQAFQDSLPELDSSPWVLQIFVKDEVDSRLEIEALRHYVKPELLDSEFTQVWLNEMDQHLKAIAKPGGLFFDEVVTKTNWKGQNRRVRLVLYRWSTYQKHESKLSNEEAINQIYDRLAASLTGAGLILKRMDGQGFHRWMMPKFNPRPKTHSEDPQAFYDLVDYPGDENLPPDYDLSSGLLFSSPRCDAESGLWYFDGLPHRVLTVEEIRKPPSIGHITGEVSRSDKKVNNAVMDLLPEGTEMALTMVAFPQDKLEDHINNLHERSYGNSVLAQSVRRDCDQAREYLSQNHKLYQSNLAFYLVGNDEADLERKTISLTTQLLTVSLKPVYPEDEVAALNAYLRWLPMNYVPDFDKKRWYTQFNYVQHLANLSPFFGRGRGTGNPGMSFFNRGGETFHIDPLNSLDRAKNAHMLFLGPTGAGKSATLNAAFSQLMAVHKPRLFVIEVGNSFGLTADYFKRNGLSVNKIKLSPGSGVSLSPFADAHRLHDAKIEAKRFQRDATDENPYELAPVEIDEEESDERDLLGEMEITARLMITGGDPREEREFRRPDRRMVRDAIYMAGEIASQEGRQCLTEDLRSAFKLISQDQELPEDRRTRAYEMSESIGLFCDGFDGEVFNREGNPWPEVDVTIIDLAHFAREGYEAQLALAVISLTNMIINLAEREQYSGRPIVQAVDECHIVTVNPLLSPFFVKVGKMGRKLSYWLWFATQNLEDFPDAAEKLLNMIEWWVCLVMPPDEVEQIARFKSLSSSQKSLLLSASKESKKYTEGVVLADRVEALFRIVPPSLYLALAGTEGDEKAHRMRIMKEYGCSELDAAIQIAKEMDVKRGIQA